MKNQNYKALNNQLIAEWIEEFQQSSYYFNQKQWQQDFIDFSITILMRHVVDKDQSIETVNTKKIEHFLTVIFPCYYHTDQEALFLEAVLKWLQWLLKTEKISTVTSLKNWLQKLQSQNILDHWKAFTDHSPSKQLLLQAISLNLNLYSVKDMVAGIEKEGIYSRDYLEEFIAPPWPFFVNGSAYYL